MIIVCLTGAAAAVAARPAVSLTVFIAAVANQRDQVARFREHRLDHCKIIGIEFDTECAGIVGDVLRHTEPSADDYPGHQQRPIFCWLITRRTRLHWRYFVPA